MKKCLFLALVLLSAIQLHAQLPNVRLQDIDGNTVQTGSISNDGNPIIISFGLSPNFFIIGQFLKHFLQFIQLLISSSNLSLNSLSLFILSPSVINNYLKRKKTVSALFSYETAFYYKI
jgi:threonine/homoserine/homoserine lactone efflux protein